MKNITLFEGRKIRRIYDEEAEMLYFLCGTLCNCSKRKLLGRFLHRRIQEKHGGSQRLRQCST